MKNLEIEPLKMIISILDRGQGVSLYKLFNQQNVRQHFVLRGVGTATSEIMSLLGLDGIEKDIIFSIGKATIVNQVLHDLNNELRSSITAKGIAFDMPLTGMSNLAALAMLAQVKKIPGREDGKMDEAEYAMIMVSMNHGFTEEVMATARTAGARGGTVLHARWAGAESVEQFYGITLQEEKEILLIVANKEMRDGIMEAINLNHGLKTEAKAVISSFAIENMVRLG